MARRYSRTPRRTRRPYVIPLVMAVALLAIGCVLASYRLQSDSSQPAATVVKGDAYELQAVVVPGNLPAQIKEYEGFTVNFNASNRTANYVSWELLRSETDGASSRNKEKFWKDDAIKNCPTTHDYTKSGYDRGHLYPAADAKWSAKSMSDCFTMANICPQVHALNGGAWKTLEEKERLWAERDSSLIVIAGPVYQPADNERIGEAGVRVPSAYFKVLFAPGVEQPRAIAFVYPNSHCPGNMQNYAQSVDYVEELTGFDFFAALPDEAETRIESSYSFKQWNKR